MQGQSQLLFKMNTSHILFFNNLKSAILLLVFIFILTGISIGQNEKTSKRHEIFDDAYKSSPAGNHPTSPAYRYVTDEFFTIQVNVNAQGENIVGDAANEPSIAHNPNNPDQIAIGWRHFETITNNFRQAGIAFTNDGGQSWTFPGVIDPGVFRSDPVLDWDADGNFYYNSLTSDGWDYTCDVYKSTDGGATWDGGTDAQGGDKQWMSIDKTSGIGSGNIYSHWTAAWSICAPDFFTRSVNDGLSYEPCTYIPGEPYWGTTMVNDNGDVYVCGAYFDNFMFARSSDAQDPAQTPTWEVTEVDLGGEIIGFGGYNCPNPNGLLGQTIIAADSSGGANDGNIYMLCSVERSSPYDPLDVMFVKSTDGGDTWSSPVRINDDPGNNAWQWFGTMSVAPDGRIDVVWLDTRDNPGSVNSALYYAFSTDGGENWSQNKKLSESFNPHLGWPDQDKMGDYFDMYSDETGAHLAWANTFNGEQDAYYAYITPDFTGIEEDSFENIVSSNQNYPNPFRTETTLKFTLAQRAHVVISVFDITGREMIVIINETKESGTWQVKFDRGSLPNGIYYYTLSAGDHKLTRKMMILD